MEFWLFYVIVLMPASLLLLAAIVYVGKQSIQYVKAYNMCYLYKPKQKHLYKKTHYMYECKKRIQFWNILLISSLTLFGLIHIYSYKIYTLFYV